MKRLAKVVTLVLVSLGCAPARAAAVDDKTDAARGVEGNWTGPLKVAPQLELPIMLELTQGKDGSLSGKWGSPDEGLADQPFASLAVRDHDLSFTMKHGASYKGTLNRSGTEISGEWSHRGRTIPVTFHRFDPSKVVVVPIPRSWKGSGKGA